MSANQHCAASRTQRSTQLVAAINVQPQPEQSITNKLQKPTGSWTKYCVCKSLPSRPQHPPGLPFLMCFQLQPRLPLPPSPFPPGDRESVPSRAGNQTRGSPSAAAEQRRGASCTRRKPPPGAGPCRRRRRRYTPHLNPTPHCSPSASRPGGGHSASFHRTRGPGNSCGPERWTGCG